ncbi:MAG: hypothetical protein ACYCOY_04635 [Metallibacterium sp.]
MKVLAISGSPRVASINSALLRTMSAVIVEAASISIPLLGSNLTESGMVESPSVSGAIRGALVALHRAVVLRQSEQGPTLPLAHG